MHDPLYERGSKVKYIKSIWKVVVRASCIYIRREKKFFNGCINVSSRVLAISTWCLLCAASRRDLSM